MKGTRLIVEPKGKNVKDWSIRSQAPNLVFVNFSVRVRGRFND